MEASRVPFCFPVTFLCRAVVVSGHPTGRAGNIWSAIRLRRCPNVGHVAGVGRRQHLSQSSWAPQETFTTSPRPHPDTTFPEADEESHGTSDQHRQRWHAHRHLRLGRQDFTFTKTLTTPFDLSKCLFDGITKASERVFGAADLEALLHSTRHIRYSTTQGTS